MPLSSWDIDKLILLVNGQTKSESSLFVLTKKFNVSKFTTGNNSLKRSAIEAWLELVAANNMVVVELIIY